MMNDELLRQLPSEAEINVNLVYELVKTLRCSDNNLRMEAERWFYKVLPKQHDAFLYHFMELALSLKDDTGSRQAALLHIKRIVPQWWSPAFDSFVGPQCFNQEIKKLVRDSLLLIIADPDSKIRSSAGYVITQIAVVDYPDEWPDLLKRLYEGTVSSDNNTIIGSLCVLQEIFDDVISETQFFDENIGVGVLEACETLLKNDNLSIEVKIESVRLVKIVCETLAYASCENSQRSQIINTAIPQTIALLIDLLKSINAIPHFYKQLLYWELLLEVCTVLDNLANVFYEIFSEPQFQMIDIIVSLLTKEEPLYNEINSKYITHDSLTSKFIDLQSFSIMQREMREPADVLIYCLSKQTELLHSLVEINQSEYPTLIQNIAELLIKANYLPAVKHDEYINDFNSFVTDETGLGTTLTVRETFAELFRQLNCRDKSILTSILVENLFRSHHDPHARVESMLYMLQCILDNDEQISPNTFKPDVLTSLFVQCIDDRFGNLNHESQILISRLVLILPKLILAFEQQIKDYGVPTLKKILSHVESIPTDESYDVLRASILISLQYFNYFIRAKEFDSDIQEKLIIIAQKLKDSASEDAQIMLLESMTIIICIDNLALSFRPEVFNQIFEIGFENSANFTINTSVLECIADYINGLPIENYLHIVSVAIPQLVNIVGSSETEYSAETDFALQIFEVLITTPKFDLPKEIFDVVFSTVSTLILRTEDDQIVQTASQLLNATICERTALVSAFQNENGSGAEILLKVVSKLLSPQMSDKAIAKIGDFVSLLIENFGDVLHSYLEKILRAITIRLTHAKEVPTIENIILIFNQLTNAQPYNTLNFLKSFSIDNKQAYILIFPIWFQAFEVMRGYSSIFSNVRAFIKIYKLCDKDLRSMPVDGDVLPNQVPNGVIVTRSMSKNMPIKFEQIPADAKIIKLLLSELRNEFTASNKQDHNLKNHKEHNGSFHDHQHNENENENENEEDEDGWEDFDDVSSDVDFHQLKEYVDEDGELVRASDRANEDMKLLLLNFFRECTSKNLADFEWIFRSVLSDAERKLLTEYLAFS